MDLESIARQLGGAVLPFTDFGGRCNCPCCGDTEANLVLKPTPSGVLFHCCKGCNKEDIKTAVQALGIQLAQPTANPTSAIDVGDWITQPAAPINPILEGVFDHGDKVVIIGQSKTRKSFFAEQLALSLASGADFLGIPVTSKKRVLLVQSEIRKDQYHWRCIRMCKELGLTSPDIKGHLWVVNARGCGAIEALIEARAEELKPEVIIIDPFYKVVSGDENSSEDIKKVLKIFDSLAETTGAAVVYIHHDKKGVSGDNQLTDRGAGSGVLARDFDSAIFLSPHENNKDLVIEFIARNYPPMEKFTVAWWDYHFAKTNEDPRKATSRTMAKEPGVTLKSQVEIASALLEGRLAAGYAEMGMESFNAMLEEGKVQRRRLKAVKEELERNGVIEIEAVKGRGRYAGKVVKIVRGRSEREIMFGQVEQPGFDTI